MRWTAGAEVDSGRVEWISLTGARGKPGGKLWTEMWNAGSRWGKKKWKQLQGRDVFFSMEKKESCLIRIYVQQTRQRGVAGWCECGSPTLPSSLGLSLRWTTGPGWVFVDLQQRGGGVKREWSRKNEEWKWGEDFILLLPVTVGCTGSQNKKSHRRSPGFAMQTIFFSFFCVLFFFCNSACWGVATQQRKTNTNPLSC